MYPACNHRFPGPLTPSVKNELAGFKKTMAGVCRKFDDNFRRSGASSRHLHEGWISHEAAIERINERCTCGMIGSEDEFESMETGSSSSSPGTPAIPDSVPLQVMPSFHVRQVTWARFVQPIDLSLIDAPSSGRGPVAFKPGGFCSTWPSEGCAF